MKDALLAAKQFLDEEVFQPALANKDLGSSYKTAIKQTRYLVSQFREIGDLKIYIDRFSDAPDASRNARTLKSHGLKTFEEIRVPFLERFAKNDDRFFVDDLIVGDECNSTFLSILARTYNNRAGGILECPLRTGETGVIAKIGFSGGRYKNKWLEQNRSIKSYLQARKNIFDETYAANQRIIAHPTRPIHCFTRQKNSGPFIYNGVFHLVKVLQETESNAIAPTKWFRFDRTYASAELRLDVADGEQLASDVALALRDSSEDRRKRLANAPKIPLKRVTLQIDFVRNPDVIAEVLHRAGGICEGCGERGPFRRRRDGSLYLEVHHKLPLARGGEDTIENAIALCPNCHRAEHHGQHPRWPDPKAD